MPQGVARNDRAIRIGQFAKALAIAIPIPAARSEQSVRGGR
jgi:hypothetical protein